MTREEAIARLKVLTDYEYDEDLESLEMAIKALEQEPCDMKQRVEKEYLYESLCEDLKKANAEIKRLSEQEAKLKEAIQKIKEEIQEKINQEIYSDGTPSEYAYCYDSVLDIIDKHLKGVENFHEPDIRDETELER